MIKDSAFDGYAVTDDGKIYSKKTNKFMKQTVGHKGYLQLCLTLGGKKHTVKVHRMVAEAFIPNPENKPQVNHIDGNKQNNHAGNLEWCTNSENQKHSYRVIGHKGRGGGGGKTPVKCIETQKVYRSATDAARETGAQITNIIRTCKNGYGTAAKLHWQYVNGGRKNAKNN